MSMWLLVCVIVLLAHTWNPPPGTAAEYGDVEMSFFTLGSWPRDNGIFNQGTTTEASIKQGFGAGVKAGLFPHFTNRMLGFEVDISGHGGALSFPNRVNGQNNGTGRSDLLILNTMFNLVLRYPGETVRPYIGIGAGWSHGMLVNPNIAGRADNDFDAAYAFGHQYLGGIQVAVSSRVFVFGEYRYFSANYHWDALAIDFRTHYGLVGAGLRF